MDYEVIKRDGSRVPFDLQKIMRAIEKSFQSIGQVPDEQIIGLLALRVCADFEKKLDGATITVEQIQDSAETILSLAGYSEAAKAYILYRKQRENVRAFKQTQEEHTRLVDSYLNETLQMQEDTSSPAYSLAGLILSNSSAITRQYWLSRVFDDEICRAHKAGTIHLHDLDMLAYSSYAWDAGLIAEKGLLVPGRKGARPARHVASFLGQLADFVTVVQNEWAGAISISRFDTVLAQFVKEDQMDSEQLKSCLEDFVQRVNAPLRWGSQPPFVNLVLDWDGEENQTGMKQVQSCLFAVLEENGPLPFPIVTIQKDSPFQKEERTNRLFSQMSQFGTAWISRPHPVMEGYFSFRPETGLYGIVSLNLPQIVRTGKDLQAYVKLAKRALLNRKEVLDQLFESGLFPFTKEYSPTLSGLYGAIGIIGLQDAVQESGLDAAEILETIQDAIGQDRILLMATPAEHAAVRMAKLDNQTDKPAYSNGTSNPMDADLVAAVLTQQKRQTYMTGTWGFPILPDRDVDPGQLETLVNWMLEKTTIRTFCYSPYFWMDAAGKRHFGIHGDKTWFRNSGSWMTFQQASPEKKQEFLQKVKFHL